MVFIVSLDIRRDNGDQKSFRPLETQRRQDRNLLSPACVGIESRLSSNRRFNINDTLNIVILALTRRR